MTPVTKEMRALIAFAAVAVLVLGAGAAAGGDAPRLPASADATLIPNYQLVQKDLATGGQPTPAGLGELKALGFRTVINLMTEAEGTQAERDAVQAAGLRYVAVPITPDRFRREDVEAIARVLDDPEARPILLHCASGNRVGAVWTVWQVTKGRAYADAEAEGRKIGLRSPGMVAAVRRVLGLEPASP
jgi:uncharacterized protein (TIGR01244 family)